MSGQPAGPAIQRASARARRRVIGLIVVLVLVGVIVRLSFERVADTLELTPIERFELILLVLAAAALPMLLVAAQLWRIGGASIASGRFPPAQTEVVVDTRIVHGRAAKLRALGLRLCALLTVLIAIGTPIGLWLMMRLVIGAG